MNIREFKKYHLQNGYVSRSNVLKNMSVHADYMCNYSIINHTVRSNIVSMINDIIRELNVQYNNSIRKLKEENTDSDSVFRQLNIPINTIEDNKNSYRLISNIINIHSFNQGNNSNFDTFSSIDKQIIRLCFNTGVMYIRDYYDLLFGNEQDIQINFTDNDLKNFELLNDNFVPIKALYKPGENKNSIRIVPKQTTCEDSHCENCNKAKYEVLLENCYKVTIKTSIPNVTLIFVGFFKDECLNSIVRTSKISQHYIYKRKSELIDYVRSNICDTGKFTDTYLKNITLGEIMSNDKRGVSNKIMGYHELYSDLSQKKFRVVISDFIKSDILIKFRMLRCLLMGSRSSVNIAGLLFGLTKDQQRDGKNNHTLLSDILYRNLGYNLQTKIRKTNSYIKEELDRLKFINLTDIDLKKQILMNTNIPDYVKKIALEKIEEMKSNNNEIYKHQMYVKYIADFPWIGEDSYDIFAAIGKDKNRCKDFMLEAKTKMDNLVYGHTECKNVINELLGKWFSNPNSMGNAIGLVGPPGVGKTLIAKGLGKVLGIPFTQVNIGGLDDGSVLSGHSFTYSGAQPGKILRNMIDAGKPRSIMLFDELDKAAIKHGINEVYNVLIHVTDQTTNDKFSDKFFQEINFPLNKVLFIFSFNDIDKIDKILLDRMDVIEVSAYSILDKINIVNNYLIKEISDNVAIENGSVTFDRKSLEYLIENYTFEAGVRDLKRKIERLFLKINLDKIYERGPYENNKIYTSNSPLVLTKDMINTYLSKPKLIIKKIHTQSNVGVINGLYATKNGFGGIIPILVYHNHCGNSKNYSLKLTGSQGKVMKESVHFAFTIAMNLIKESYREEFLNKNHSGLHIHTPDGATPKDGPSAGSAFTTAFISKILGKRIKNKIAMTGEIEINGNITAIGGLEFKLLGAYKAGVQLVFVPKENMDDVLKVKEINDCICDIYNPQKNRDVLDKFPKSKTFTKNDDRLKIMFVDQIHDILDYALLEDDSKETDVFRKTFDSKIYVDR